MTVNAEALAAPAREEIVRVCRAATAHNYGQAVLAAHSSARGVRVRLSSWPRQQEALRDLRALGYAVVVDSRPIGVEHGEALLVTGWDPQLLAARVARLDLALRDAERAPREVASYAVDWFRLDVDDLGLSEDEAQQRAVDETRRRITRGTGCRRWMSAPVDPGDLDDAAPPVRALLVRVTDAQTALDRVSRDHAAVAEAAIGLFLVYRDASGGDDEDQAAARAVADACAHLAGDCGAERHP